MPGRLRLFEHDRVADHVNVADADHVDVNYQVTGPGRPGAVPPPGSATG